MDIEEPSAQPDPAAPGKGQYEETSSQELKRILDLQKEAFAKNPYPLLEERLENLQKLLVLIKENADKISLAIEADFGHRSHYETKLAEIFNMLQAIKHARRNMKRWMKPHRKLASIWFQPGRAMVIPQPVGVVGIIGPWNYPVLLAVQPMVAALSAGNRVMVKLSEYTPRTASLMAELFEGAFPEDQVKVVQGGPATAKAMTHLPFDHLMYTGSNARGREVLKAASENMTPATLEMGGKSPAIIHPEFPSGAAAANIISTKLLNAGQTCIAPDYVMVHEGKVQEFVSAARAVCASMFPSFETDYTSLINQTHYRRIMEYIQDAKDKGAEVLDMGPAGGELSGESGRIAPKIILNVTDDMLVAREEIFGPLLPVLTFCNVEEARAYVNSRPRPLALYYFDNDSGRIDHMLKNTISGGVTINGAVWHFCQSGLPFGGVGASGMGHYHGEYGFNTFSHLKAVYVQSRYNGLWLIGRPFSWLTDWALKLMIR